MSVTGVMGPLKESRRECEEKSGNVDTLCGLFQEISSGYDVQ